MATKPTPPGLLTGQAAIDASGPLDPSVRGGLGTAFRGITEGPALSANGQPNAVTATLGLPGQSDETETPFAGMGPLLEDPDDVVFKTLDGLVQRQEQIALNHLAQDTHWTYVKMGYPWSTLTKEPTRDRYVQSLPYGSAGITIQAVPNKAWDLINKTTEALLVDFPVAECEPGDDSEQAEGACDMANRFLAQDASEHGTNDTALFWDRTQRSLTCASSYLECWTDPTGGGYVPLQIPAHPQAASPMQPLVGPDGMPTVSPILRYVTSVGPDGQATPDSQFTADPTQAAPQWQPKLRASKWQREHIRVYPETATVATAQKVIILGYCTLDEGKRRWPQVAAMQPDELTKLCDWTPARYLALLPPFQRGRWQLTDGRTKEKQGSSDERIFFYYHCYAKASPDHTKGADVVVTGALDKRVLDRKLLSVEVEVPAKPVAAAMPADGSTAAPPDPSAPGTTKETRCMEIPVAQITPRGDPDDQDPTGRAYIELIAGAVENNAHLAMSASEIIDKNLHLEAYSTSTSPISGNQREDARATGDIIPVIRADDIPKWGTAIPFETAFFNFFELSDQAINTMGSSERAAKGQTSDEKSGRAIQLATANNNVSLGGMNRAVCVDAYSRWSLIKVQRAMADFTTAQQVNYVGDDGIFKQEDWTGLDFALVGKVTIKSGTGGLETPDQKIQNAMGLAQAQILTLDEAKDVARPAFARKLGLPADPHEQRVERQITAFEKGPPSPEWAQQWDQYQAQLQAYQAMQQNADLAAQNAAAQSQHATATVGAPPAPVAPIQIAMVPPTMPWTPFTPLPTDSEPLIATMRMRRLSRMIDEAKFESYPPQWQGVAITEYQRMAQVVQSVTPVPPLPKGVVIQAKAGDPQSLAADEQAATRPGSVPPTPPPAATRATPPARPHPAPSPLAGVH